LVNAIDLCREMFEPRVELGRVGGHQSVEVELLDAIEFTAEVGIRVLPCSEAIFHPQRAGAVCAESGEGCGEVFLLAHVLLTRVPQGHARPARGRLNHGLRRHESTKAVTEHVHRFVPVQRVDDADEVAAQFGK
jgi:hypothetical protein